MANTAKLELKKAIFNFSVPDTLYSFDKDPNSSYFKLSNTTMNKNEKNTLKLDDGIEIYSDIDLFPYLEKKFVTGGEYELNTDNVLTFNQAYAYWFYNNYEKVREQETLDNKVFYVYKKKNEIAIAYDNKGGTSLNYALNKIYQNSPNKIIKPLTSFPSLSENEEYFNYLFKYDGNNNEDYDITKFKAVGYNKIYQSFYPEHRYTTSISISGIPSTPKKVGEYIYIPKSAYKGQIFHYSNNDYIINFQEQDLNTIKSQCYFLEQGVRICSPTEYAQYDNSVSKIIAEDNLRSFLLSNSSSKEVYEIKIFDDNINLYIDNGESSLKKVYFNTFYISKNTTTISYAEEFKYINKIGEMQFIYDFSNISQSLMQQPNYLSLKFYYKNNYIGNITKLPCDFSINELGEKILTINKSSNGNDTNAKEIGKERFFTGGLLQQGNTNNYINKADGSPDYNDKIRNWFGSDDENRADLYCNYLKSHDVGTLFNCQTEADLLKNGVVAFQKESWGGEGTTMYAGYIKVNNDLYRDRDAEYCYVVMRNDQDYQMKIDFYHGDTYLFSSNSMTLHFKELPTIKIINNKDSTELLIDEDNVYDCVSIPKMRIELSQKNIFSYGRYLLYEADKTHNKKKTLIKSQDINFYENLDDNINLFYYDELNNEFKVKRYILQVVAISVNGEEIKSPEYKIKIASNGIENVLIQNKDSSFLIKNETQLSLTKFSEDIALFNITSEKEKNTSENFNNLTLSTFSAPVSINFKLNKQKLYDIVKNFDYSNSQYCRIKLGNFSIDQDNYLLFWDLRYDGNDIIKIGGILSLDKSSLPHTIFTDDGNCSVILRKQIKDNEDFYITLYFQNSQYYLGITKNCFEINNTDLSKPDFWLQNDDFYAGRPIYFDNQQPADAEFSIFTKTASLEFFNDIVQEVFSVEYTKNLKPPTEQNLITYYFVKDQNISYKYTFSFPQLLKNEAITVEINNIEYTNFLLDIFTTLNYEFIIYKDKIIIKKDNVDIQEIIWTNIVAEWQSIQNNFTLNFYSDKWNSGDLLTDGVLCWVVDYIYNYQLKITKIVGYSDIIKNIYFNDSKQGLFIQSFTNIETLPDTNIILNKKELLLQIQDKNNIKHNRICNIYIEDYFIDYSKNKPIKSIKNYIITQNFVKNLSTIIVPGHGYNFYIRACEDENFEFQRTNLFYSIEPDPNYIGEYIRVIFLNEPKNTYSNYSLGDEFAFECNIEQGALTQNFEKAALDNYSKYPKFSIGNKNYFTGSVNCLLGDVKYREGETTEITEYRQSIDLPYAYYEEMDIYNKWLENIASGKPALIIDQKGRTFVSQITDNSINMFTPYGPKPSGISFSFTECDDFANIKILEVS